jgi:hypothetical protein
MSGKQGVGGRTEESAEFEALDPVLQQSLGDFKASVHAWSDAMVSRPRTARQVVVRRTWRLAAGWALASVLLAGAASGGLYEHHHRQEMARIAAARAAEHERQAAAERARTEEDLLARVDSDVSREVPSALEPLAQLMTQDVTQ